ncbi:MAG: hypothetical protein ACTSR8_08100 [Promethearchaeota archaeon]
MIEEKSKLIDYLNFQISRRDTFYKKIPAFREQIKQCNNSIMEIRNKFEVLRKRETYKSVLDEFKGLLKKNNQE